MLEAKNENDYARLTRLMRVSISRTEYLIEPTDSIRFERNTTSSLDTSRRKRVQRVASFHHPTPLCYSFDCVNWIYMGRLCKNCRSIKSILHVETKMVGTLGRYKNQLISFVIDNEALTRISPPFSSRKISGLTNWKMKVPLVVVRSLPASSSF